MRGTVLVLGPIAMTRIMDCIPMEAWMKTSFPYMVSDLLPDEIFRRINRLIKNRFFLARWLLGGLDSPIQQTPLQEKYFYPGTIRMLRLSVCTKTMNSVPSLW